MDLQDFPTTFPGRNADLYLPVETTRSSQSGVDSIFPVGGTDDDHLAPSGHAVHQGEQLGDDPPFDLARNVLAFRRDRIQLIYENDGGRVLFRFLELLP